MNFAELDNTPVRESLKGLELKRWFDSVPDLKAALRQLLAKRALVCVSPNRHRRCDEPATGIFWQDEAEWYPCCDAHWPGGPQRQGSTRWRGGFVGLRCFEERIIVEDLRGFFKVEKYDRTDAA